MAKSSTANNSYQLGREWFKKGDADIDFARIGFKETEHYGEVCFLCQQASEKYLKGFLVVNKIEPKKVHSTATLAKRCSQVNKEFLKLINPCKILDRYYIPTRYPVHSEKLYRMQDAKEAIEIAESLIELVLCLTK